MPAFCLTSKRSRGQASAQLSGNHFGSVLGSSHVIGRALQSDVNISPLSADTKYATYMGTTFERAYIWNGSAMVLLNPDTNGGADPGQFGIEFGAAISWEEHSVSGNLYLLKNGISGAGYSQYTPGGTNYNAFKTEHDQAIAWFAANGITLASRDFVWFSTADSALDQATHESSLNTLLGALATDGIRTASSKTLLYQAPAGSSSDTSAMRAAKSAIAAADPTHIFTCNPHGYLKPGDTVHQDGQGQVENGFLFAEAFLGCPHIAI